MSFFDLFRKKKDKPKVSEPEKEEIIAPAPAEEELPEPDMSDDDEPNLSLSDDDEPNLSLGDDDDPNLSMSSNDSLSFSLSKDSILEEITKDDSSDPDSITNEEITKGITLLDTYEVISDAIKGGMGSVWKVHHKGWNADLAMKEVRL